MRVKMFIVLTSMIPRVIPSFITNNQKVGSRAFAGRYAVSILSDLHFNRTVRPFRTKNLDCRIVQRQARCSRPVRSEDINPKKSYSKVTTRMP